jgi:signal transduction histidine kinase/ligand-binding sensor domain-containing protein/DNA-binding response OmpR family regulator
MRYLIIIYTLLLIHPAPLFSQGQAPRLRFTHISNEQGLSNSTIETIFQDSRGFIWLGTRDGLNRYDGSEIVVYRNDPSDTTSLSDNYIRCIYEDKQHNLWIGTINGLNRFNLTTNNFTRLKHRDKVSASLSNNLVTSVAEDGRGNLYVGSFGGGLQRLDPGTQRFMSVGDHLNINCLHQDRFGNIWIGAQTGLYKLRDSLIQITNRATTNSSGNIITAIREDRQGNLWIGTEDDGLFLFDPTQNNFIRYGHSDQQQGSLGSNLVRCLLVDKKGQLWAGGINGGLNLFNAPSRLFFHYENEPGNSSSLSQRTISALFEDRQGNIWIGTHRGGVNIYSPGLEKFNLFRQESSPASLGYNDVKAFCEDREGNIWVGTDGGGLDLFNREKRSFRHYRYDPFKNNTIGSDAVLDVMQDKKGNIWLSTWGGGLELLHKDGTFTRFQNNPADSNSISSNFVQKTFEDYEGRLWVATYYGGLNVFDPEKRLFTRMVKDPGGKSALSGKNIVSLLEDKEGHTWIGTDDGGLNCYHQATRHFSHYFDKGEKMPDLRVLFMDNKGRLWVGQKGLYLFDPSKDSFSLYTDKGGLSEEFIKGITEDEAGSLWIATSNGLTQFNPDNGNFKKFNTGDGLQGLEFEANACLRTKDGEMYFGGINGFNSFYPAGIHVNPFVPPVYITGFQLFNRKVLVGEKGSPLQKDISLTKEIVLSYKQSTFSFNFAALNLTAPENNRYAYMLDGAESSWNYVGKEKKSTYTNLSPGEYTFRVKASNNDGIWNEDGASIKIIITPPFWKTTWFTSLLILLAIAGLYLLYKQRTKQKIRQIEETKRQEMHKVQLQFFTNISHEFRTPLSLILGPLERLMKENARPALQHYFDLMYRNTQRLLDLINELMDFGKLESGALKLAVMKGNLPTFLDEIAEEFRDWALQKEIHFTVQKSSIEQDTWFDRQILEKIILNLLHNSFKYTRPGGSTHLEVFSTLEKFQPSFAGELILKNSFRGKSYAYILVADSGIGISRESLPHLFERYYRITDSHLGSGIGLAFVKSLAMMHKGDIYVYSERQKGTEIIIGIPIEKSDYSIDERREDNAPAPGVRLETLTTGEPHSPITQTSENSPADAVLLVEDNEELRLFLKDSLAPHYMVIEAVNGLDGLAKAKEHHPGFIISDVIMPGMDGIQLCKAIKHDIETSHIPFLMLTARTALASQMEGLDSGADYYFPKPLNMDLLLLTIRNRFEHAKKLRERYTRESNIEAMDLVHSGKDREFMKHLLEVIDTQLVNPDFDIEWLCQEMGMSRTSLYQKIKNISQQSIGDFIRTIRLKKAVQIMTHEDVSLAEVMYRIGIQTQSYFTKAFKKEFGKTPTQFMQEIRNPK